MPQKYMNIILIEWFYYLDNVTFYYKLFSHSWLLNNYYDENSITFNKKFYIKKHSGWEIFSDMSLVTLFL